MDLLNNLNDKQREAALCTEGPLLILAGAGSGKTATMTQRIAYLVREKDVRPYNILAVTFTNKAAKEMRERVENLIGNTRGMWIMTFHSACLRILRADSELLGYTSDFAVYDPTDQKTVIKSIMKEQNINDKEYKPAYLLSIISNCKNSMQSPDDYLKSEGENFRTKIIYNAYRGYQKVLKKNNAMDFDDLLVNAVRLLKKEEEVLLKYQDRFHYIMVDEYQDTNSVQYQFIRLLAEARNNICVVGDDDQCIYQWRGADINNILDFEHDFKGTKVVKLEQNYRSTSNILDAAHSVIKNNRGRKDKKLWTQTDAGESIVYYRADDEREEARYVASEISRLKHDGREYRDFAILYRTNAQSRTFEEALSAKGITYRMLGGTRYYDRKEIKDMMSYMRLVQNYKDDLSLSRIINEPKRGIGAKTLEKLITLGQVEGLSLFEVLQNDMIVQGLPSKAVRPVKEMMSTIWEYHNEIDNLRIADIYDGLLAHTGYFEALEKQNTIESMGRLENLLEFKSVINDYERDNPEITLAEFMENIALMAEVDNYDSEEDSVVLMTMHGAKGLEFPVVFMPGMEDGLFPGWRSLDSSEAIEEERRLCYVGMTRAKERLFMTSAAMRTMFGKTDYTRESQFLREIDEHLIDGDSVFHKKPGANKFGGSLDGGSSGTGKPFDSFKYAQKSIKNLTNKKSAITMVAGDRVSHAKFGPGTVLTIKGNVVTIQFDSGQTKKLAKDIAPLQKI